MHIIHVKRFLKMIDYFMYKPKRFQNRIFREGTLKIALFSDRMEPELRFIKCYKL